MISRRALQRGRQRSALHLIVDGVSRYYSDASIAFVDSTPGSPGEITTKAGLNEPELAATLGSSDEGATIELLDPAEWPALIAGLSGAWAELSQICEGQDWTERRILVKGYLDSPIYGSRYEPIRWGLQAAPWEDRGLLPLPTWQVGFETWPRDGSALTCPESLFGAFYPVVFGDPGNDANAEEADWYPIPALLVEIDPTNDPPDNALEGATVLLGYGALACIGDSIEIFNENTGTACTIAPSLATDKMGTPVTILQVQASDMAVVLGDVLYWRPSAGGKAGIANTGSAGKALRYLLSWASAEVDPDVLQDVCDRLDRWRVGFFLNEPTSPYQWAQDHLLSILPVAAIDGPAGSAFVVLPVDPSDFDAEVLDVDLAGGQREGAVEVSSWREISTSLSIEYAPDTRLDMYRRRIDLDPTLQFAVGSRQPTPYGAAASTRYSGLRLLSLTADAFCDPLTATALAEYRLRQAAQLTQTVSVSLPQAYQYLLPGDILRISIADIGWSEMLCIVVSVPRISGMGVFVFTTVPDWSRGGVS